MLLALSNLGYHVSPICSFYLGQDLLKIGLQWLHSLLLGIWCLWILPKQLTSLKIDTQFTCWNDRWPISKGVNSSPVSSAAVAIMTFHHMVNEIPAISSIRHSCSNALLCLMSWVLPAAKLEFLGICKAETMQHSAVGFTGISGLNWNFTAKLSSDTWVWEKTAPKPSFGKDAFGNTRPVMTKLRNDT